MRGIVYVSKAVVPFDDEGLTELAAQASKRNAELGVTGYLFFEKGRFVQYVEGEAEVVSGLMERIARDERHDVLHQVQADDVDERRFPSWNMRQLVRTDFVEIRLEHLLTDHLLFLQRLPDNDERWSHSVWSMVQRIAGLQARIAGRAI